MIPALIVGGAMAGASIINNYNNAKAQNEAANDAKKGASSAASSVANSWNQTKGTFDENQKSIDDFYSKVKGLYGDEADLADYSKKYRDILSQDMSDAIYKPGDFEYDKSVEEFYDKAWKLNNQAQMDAMEASASNAGNLYSSGLINQMASTTAANATKAYREAMEAYLKDKGIAADIWGTEEANKQAAATSMRDTYKTQLDSYGKYMGDAMGAYGDALSAAINNRNAKADTYANYVGNYINQIANAGGTNAGMLNY